MHKTLAPKIKALRKLVLVRKGKFFASYDIDSEEDTCFYLKFDYVHSTLPANNRIAMDNKHKKVVKVGTIIMASTVEN